MKSFFDNLMSAIQFITILPTGKNRTFNAEGMTPCFPLVGLLLGIILAVFDKICVMFWPSSVAALLDVIVMIVLTGAFHLDGLGDTADGLFSHRSKERALEIMKDSRIGTMGVLAIVCGLAVKWAGISTLSGTGFTRSLLLIIIPAYARSGILFGIKYLPYGRSEGTGKSHFEKPLVMKSFTWMIIPMGLSLLLGFKGLLLNLFFALIVSGLIVFYKRKMGCITGDMLGAMVEVTESLLFLLVTTV